MEKKKIHRNRIYAKGKDCVFYKHGRSGNPLYYVYTAMISRCHNPNNPSYSRYGAIGRLVCEEWRNDIDSFFNWAYANGYQKGLTLDRIDNEKGYSPENCRWVDRYVQQNNMRRNHFISINGETHSISEWARLVNIPKGRIVNRLKRGWSEEDAVFLPKSNDRYKTRKTK